ncbi:hemerythrin domain-containing protein [Streptomyces sp. NPDC050315]|uniref:hemerythrin domain-containing protein n=1 Tax=Streptomyces sp. NPDC050315 TaxID=3155039 RepID=UPI00344897E2
MADAADPADVVTALTEQHQELERALAEVLELPAGDPRRRSRLKETAVTLACHAAAAERHVHRAVHRYVPDDADRFVRQEITDLLRAEETMKDLEFTDTDSGEFDPLVRRLLTRIRRHGDAEEADLFPRLRRAASPEVLAGLADAVHQVEAQAAVLRDEVRASRRRDVLDRVLTALAEQDAPMGAYRQAEQFDRFLTGDAEWSGM